MAYFRLLPDIAKVQHPGGCIGMIARAEFA